MQGPIPRIHSPNINAVGISFSPALTGAACFAQPTAGRIGGRLNNGLLAIYESALAINTNGYIFVEADFVC